MNVYWRNKSLAIKRPFSLTGCFCRRDSFRDPTNSKEYPLHARVISSESEISSHLGILFFVVAEGHKISATATHTYIIEQSKKGIVNFCLLFLIFLPRRKFKAKTRKDKLCTISFHGGRESLICETIWASPVCLLNLVTYLIFLFQFPLHLTITVFTFSLTVFCLAWLKCALTYILLSPKFFSLKGWFKKQRKEMT